MNSNKSYIDTENNIELGPFWLRVLRRFSWVYLLTTAILISIIVIFYQDYTKKLERNMLLQEEAFIASTTQALQKEMQIQLMTLQMVSRSKVLGDFLENGSDSSRHALEELFVNLAITFHRYDQIRVIGMDGNERIRVNYESGNTEIVKDSNLQNKKYSLYFEEALKLSAGEVYVAPMELNVEYGEVEFPYKPVIRFSTPITNNQGNTVGLLVINYLATELLQNFRDQMELRISGQGMLIDPRGYWISNHDRNNEWGGSLGDVDEKFEDLYPTAWPIIKNNPDGIFKSDHGLFRYVSIKPFKQDSIGSFKAEKTISLSVTEHSKKINDWRLVIFMPNETIQENSFFHSNIGRLAFAALFIAVAAIILLILIMLEQTRRKRYTDMVVKRELSDLYENSPCGYHSLDKNGIVLRINQTELNWLGFTRDEVIGKSFSAFLATDSIDVFHEFIEQLQRDKEIEGVVLEVKCKNRATFFVSTSATSILEKGHFAIARTSAFDITDRIELENRLAYIANTDVLTGISNRRHFFIQAMELFQSECDISILMIDADKFKNVNDQYGHDIGDKVLKMIASTLQGSMPEGGIIARLGGEEFVMLVSNLDAQSGLNLAQKLCLDIESKPIAITDNTTINITISIGTSQRKTYEENIDEILKRADLALYEAKSTGRNKAVQARR